MTTLTKGTRVQFLGNSAVGSEIYKGLVGTVEHDRSDISGFVHINIRAKGQRKDRLLCVYKDNLQVI